MTVDRWAVRFGSEEGTGRGRSPPRSPPPRCTKCNIPPINSQCTNHRIADPLLCGFNVPIKGLIPTEFRNCVSGMRIPELIGTISW